MSNQGVATAAASLNFEESIYARIGQVGGVKLSLVKGMGGGPYNALLITYSSHSRNNSPLLWHDMSPMTITDILLHHPARPPRAGGGIFMALRKQSGGGGGEGEGGRREGRERGEEGRGGRGVRGVRKGGEGEE